MPIMLASWSLSRVRQGFRSGDAPVTVVFAALLALTLLVYWPGLSGIYLLDDTVNLGGLARITASGDCAQGLAYVFSGVSGPTGRPATLLTFAAQHWSWPYAPANFKYVNVLLHLLNGCLLYWLVLRTGWLVAGRAARVSWWATLVVGLWLLHPLHVSTVLYIIQRMTELAAAFTLTGLLLYAHGREVGAAGRNGAAYGWMSVGLVLGTGLGTLSKESAILLPLFVLVIELTVLRPIPRPTGWGRWAAVFLALPLLLLVAYLAARLGTYILPQYDSLRSFTMGERLLTESRVLCDYLAKLLLLRPHAFGGYYDAYTASRGLLDPMSTLPAVATVCILFITALRLRSRAPIYAFAVLGFIAGHVLESTILPLELYFEHRNYLPSVAVLIGVAYYLPRSVAAVRSAALRRVLAVLGVGVLASLPLYTLAQARLWGRPLVQARYWAERDPGSVRAQLGYGGIALFTHRDLLAERIFASLTRSHPEDPVGMLSLVKTACVSPAVAPPSRSEFVSALARGKDSFGALHILNDIVTLKEEGRCPDSDIDTLVAGVRAVLNNPSYRTQRHNLLVMLARLQHAAGRPDDAGASLNQALALSRNEETTLLLVQWLAAEGRTTDALDVLETAEVQRCGLCLQALREDPRLQRWLQQLKDAGIAGSRNGP